MKEVLGYIKRLKREINKRLEIDYKIDADPYDNIARMVICEKIEKFILNNGLNHQHRRKCFDHNRTVQ